MNKRFLFAATLSFTLTACSTIYYSAWEKLGYEKRDLLIMNCRIQGL